LDFQVLPEWRVLPVFKVHMGQEAYKAFVGMLVLMDFPVVMVKTEQRETREIAVLKAHKVPWVQEAIRENKVQRDSKANKVQLVLAESRDRVGLEAIPVLKDHRANEVYPEKEANKAQKVQSAHRDHKENAVKLVQLVQ
jgi:hypothetical protein